MAAAAERAAAAARRHSHARADAAIRLPWVPLGRARGGDGFVWAAQDGGPELARISIASGRLERFRPGRLAVDRGSPPATARSGSPARARSRGSCPGTAPPGATSRTTAAAGSTFGDGALWSLEGHGVLRKLDPDTGRVLARDRPPRHRQRRRGGRRARLGVGRPGRRRLRARRATTCACGARSRPAPIPSGSRSPAAGCGSRTRAARSVTSLDPRTGARRRLARRRDADGGRVRQRGRVGGDGAGAAAAAAGRRARAAALAPRAIPHPRPGGRRTRPPTSSSRRRRARACSPTRTGRPRREALRPEVAAAMPQVSRDGRTYTFRIRGGLPLLAAVERGGDGGDVQAHARARVLAEARPRRARPERGARDRGARGVLRRQGRARLRDQGARRHALDHARAAVGRLPRADLAAAPLPGPAERADPPDAPERPLPSSGPYYVSSAADGRIVLLPNPGYGGDRPRRWARIVYTLDVPTPTPSRSSTAASSTTCRSTSTATRCSGAAACSTGATGRGARPHGGRPALLPHHGRVPRLHRAQRQPPALPRRAAAARRQLRARPPALARAFHDARATRSSRRPSPASRPARSIRSTGPTSRRRAGSQATGSGSAVLSYCTFFPSATTACARSRRIVKANLARIGIDVVDRAHRRVPAGRTTRARTAPTCCSSRTSARTSATRRPTSTARSPTAGTRSALGPGPWNSPSFRRRFEARGRCAARRGRARTCASSAS